MYYKKHKSQPCNDCAYCNRNELVEAGFYSYQRVSKFNEETGTYETDRLWFCRELCCNMWKIDNGVWPPGTIPKKIYDECKEKFYTRKYNEEAYNTEMDLLKE